MSRRLDIALAMLSVAMLVLFIDLVAVLTGRVSKEPIVLVFQLVFVALVFFGALAWIFWREALDGDQAEGGV